MGKAYVCRGGSTLSWKKSTSESDMGSRHLNKHEELYLGPMRTGPTALGLGSRTFLGNNVIQHIVTGAVNEDGAVHASFICIENQSIPLCKVPQILWQSAREDMRPRGPCLQCRKIRAIGSLASCKL